MANEKGRGSWDVRGHCVMGREGDPCKVLFGSRYFSLLLQFTPLPHMIPPSTLSFSNLPTFGTNKHPPKTIAYSQT